MIAVCITTYNHEPFIAEAIESVLAQGCDEPVPTNDDTALFKAVYESVL